MPAPPAFSIPASVISFDDTLAALGAESLQHAVEILAARLARLEAAPPSGGVLDFFDPDNSGLYGGI